MVFGGQNYLNFGHTEFDLKGKWDNAEEVLCKLWSVTEIGYFKRKWLRPFYGSTKTHQHSPQTIKAHELYIVEQSFHISGSTPRRNDTISTTVISCEMGGSCLHGLIWVSVFTCSHIRPCQKSYKITELLPWWPSAGGRLSSEMDGTWEGFPRWVLILGFWCSVSLKLDLSRNRHNDFVHLNYQVKWLIINTEKIIN